ncbi:MAG: transport-associated protein [Desulfuromonas sp.]|nr:MAG: transport-associated protein [Desulfuromonas sp.]
MAIITISRELGSGGIPIAHAAAEKLGYTLVDGEALRKIAGKFGLTEEAFEQADEHPPAFVAEKDFSLLVNLHRIELMILDYALKGDVIIYGRGGQDLLKDIKSVFRTRIVAPFEDRVERWAEREWIDPELARFLVRKSDQQRAGFIKYYFDRDWEDPLDYDLVINTQRLSEGKAVELICSGVSDKNLVEEKSNSKRILSDLIMCKKAEISVLSLQDIDGQHLSLSAENGTVTVSGHVHSKEDHAAVLDAVAKTESVGNAKDKLQVISYRQEPDDH